MYLQDGVSNLFSNHVFSYSYIVSIKGDDCINYYIIVLSFADGSIVGDQLLWMLQVSEKFKVALTSGQWWQSGLLVSSLSIAF